MRASIAARFPEPCEECGCDSHNTEAHLAAQIADDEMCRFEEQLVAQIAEATVANDVGGLRYRLRIVGMPEVHGAIDGGHARAVFAIALSTRGLGADAIELAADEEIAARTRLTFVEDVGTFEGEYILIIKRTALPRLKITADDPRVAELARVLARDAVQR